MLLHAPSCPLCSPGCRSPLFKHTYLLRAQRCTRTQSQSLHDSPQRSASTENPHRQHRAGVQARSSTTDLESEIGTAGQEAVVQEAEPYITHSWKWRDHTINYAVAGCGPPVVFVHGFGASIGHFRKNIPALSQSYKVYAIDLLGFGRSDKPILSYSTELWRDQLLDFLAEFVDRPAFLVGNSIGSIISLMASAEGGPDKVKGTILLNCAGGMNTKGLTDDWRVRLATPIFQLIDLLLSRQRIARFLFDNFRTRDNLKKVLQRVYINPDAVDDALVDLIHTPSEAQGALEAFISVISGPPGPRPEAIFDRVSGPILLLWGQRDEVTPLDGPVAKFMKTAADSRPQTKFEVLQGVGHCLHDDDPRLVNGEILKWLREHHAD